jgi:hypothetical protein
LRRPGAVAPLEARHAVEPALRVARGGAAVSRALRRAQTPGAVAARTIFEPGRSGDASPRARIAPVLAVSARIGTNVAGIRAPSNAEPSAPPAPTSGRTDEPDVGHRLSRAVQSLEVVQASLARLAPGLAAEVRWLDDDEVVGSLQRVLGRQARARGIDLS